MIQKLDPKIWQKWPVHISSILIAYNTTRSLVTGYSLYFLMFERQPRLPIDLLFPTKCAHQLSCTIDEYVWTLYDCLRDSLKIAQEAHRQKWLYDRKVSAVELRLGDHVLVHLDTFQGQHRKLKNQWGSDLHTVVCHVTDGIPAYVVKNDQTGKTKVLHRIRLLLWLANFGEPVRCNFAVTSNTLTGKVLENQLSGSAACVPMQERMYYSTDLAMYRAILDNPESMSHRLGCEVCMGVCNDEAIDVFPTK